MKQLSLFETTALFTQKPINVASVPQRSPFRYPGGKTWLVPYVNYWLKSLAYYPIDFVEPFCGGANVGLNIAFEQIAEHVTLVELDEQVAAVWQTIINHDKGGWLSDKITSFDLTAQNLDLILNTHPANLAENAFQTILKNRVNRGGILAPGVGRVKEGENGKGLLSRWYPQTLKQRIMAISKIKQKLTFIHGDGLEVLQQKANEKKAVFFIDPPYTVTGPGKKPGSRLYRYSDINHEELFRITNSLSGNFLMTYNNTPEVLALAKLYNFDTDLVVMKNTHHTHLYELLVSRNLDWFRALYRLDSKN